MTDSIADEKVIMIKEAVSKTPLVIIDIILKLKALAQSGTQKIQKLTYLILYAQHPNTAVRYSDDNDSMVMRSPPTAKQMNGNQKMLDLKRMDKF